MIGVLALYHSGRNADSRDHLRVLQAVRGKLTAAIGNSLKRHPAEAVFECRCVDQPAERPRAVPAFRCRNRQRRVRDNSTLGIIVCDIDGFRQVNNRYGSLAGDQLIRSVACELRQSCRGSDYIARVGGDEFATVMEGLSRPAAEQRMRHIDGLVREAGLKLCGEEIVALSCAYVLFPADGVTAEELLAEADRRMQQRKLERRTQCPHWPSKWHDLFLQPQVQELVGQLLRDIGDNFGLRLLLGHLDGIVELQQVGLVVGRVQPSEPNQSTNQIVNELRIALGTAIHHGHRVDAIGQVHSQRGAIHRSQGLQDIAEVSFARQRQIQILDASGKRG